MTTTNKLKPPKQTSLSSNKFIVLIISILLILLALSFYFIHRHFNNTLQKTENEYNQEMNFVLQNEIAQKELLAKQTQTIDSLQQRLKQEKELIAETKKATERQLRRIQNRIKPAENSASEAWAAHETLTKEKDKADLQKILAEKQAEVAEKLAAEAVRLSLLETARSMSLKARQFSAEGNDTMAALLAVQAYEMNLDNQGRQNNSEILNAMSLAVKKEQFVSGHFDAIRKISWDSRSGSLYTVSDDGSIMRWCRVNKDDNFSVCASIEPVSVGIRSLAVACMPVDWETGGETVAMGTTDGRIIFWNVNDSLIIPLVIAAHKGIVSAIAFSLDDKRVFSAGHDGQVSEWSNSGDLIRHLQAPTNGLRVNDMCLHPQGEVLAWADSKGGISFASLKGTDILRHRTNKTISAITFSTDGRLFAYGTINGVITVCNYPSFSQVVQKQVHKSAINQLVFHPTLAMLASCGFDGTVQTIQIDSGKVSPVILDNIPSWIYSIAFQPGGNNIAAAGTDKIIRIFPIISDTIAQRLCTQAGRSLTPEEWNTLIGSHIPYVPACGGKFNNNSPGK